MRKFLRMFGAFVLFSLGCTMPTMAQDFGALVQSQVVSAGGGAFGGLSEATLNVGTHKLVWVASGTVSTCTVQLESSTTLTGTYALLSGTAAQTCTSSGAITWTGISGVNFVRVNFTALTGSGNVTFFYSAELNTSSVPTQVGSIVTGLSVNSSGQLTLAAQGSNQNVVLTPSGTGVVSVGANGYGATTGGGAGSGIVMFADTGNPAAGTTGTNTTGVANQLWYTTIYAPHSFTVSNLAVLSGGTATTDKIAIGIWSLSGTLLACTSTTVGGGTTLSGANTWQKLALSASCPNGATTFTLAGGTHYIVGVVTSGTTAGDIQTYPLANGPWASVASGQGTLATFTPAVTQTASAAPYIMVQ